MTKQRPAFPKWIVAASACLFLNTRIVAQVVLSGTSYLEDFDSLGSGLPLGWTVRTGANGSSLGTAATFSTAAVSWGNNTGAFKNLASSTGLTSTTIAASQEASADRALGIRQTGSFGDPGAAFTLQIQDTIGLQGFALSFSAEMLSVQDRSTTWTIQYATGSSPTSFSTLTTYSDPGAFGATTVTANLPAGVNGLADNLWIRIVALAASTGPNSRDSFGIDDFSLTFSPVPVPEPETYALVAGVGLVGFGLWRRTRRA